MRDNEHSKLNHCYFGLSRCKHLRKNIPGSITVQLSAINRQLFTKARIWFVAIDCWDITASTLVLGAFMNPDSLCASVFRQLGGQAGLPFEERFKFS